MGSRKKLGIIGGMGSDATQVFLKYIFDNTDASCDQEHLDIIAYNHASLPDRTSMILGGKEDDLWKLLSADITMLTGLGCEHIAIPCNTSHYFSDRIKNIAPGFINMIEQTAQYLKQIGAKRAGIMATNGTIKSGLYERAFAAQGLEAAYPSMTDQQRVMQIIYEQIKSGKKCDMPIFYRVVKNLLSSGCDLIVLGCTELSVIKMYDLLDDSIYVDALEVLARSCVEQCAGKLKRRSVGHLGQLF